MKTEDFERLKAVCEKEGFEIDGVMNNEGVYFIKKKDIWDGVEFVLDTFNGNILRVDSLKLKPSPMVFKPSTESAYVDQLKKECLERLNGYTKTGLYITGISGGAISTREEFVYRKDTDTLYWFGCPVYQSGKWATRVNERIEVKFDGGNLQSRAFFFMYGKDAEHKMVDLGCFKVGEFLSSQLEKYLNNEV